MTLEVQDVDAYRSMLSGWEIEVVPLDRGPFRLTWVERDLPDISVVRFGTDLSMREVYVKDADTTAFVLMLPASHDPFRVQGAETEPLTLTLLQPETEYEVVSPAGGETLEVYIPNRVSTSLGLERWLDPSVVNVRPDPLRAQHLWRVLSPMATAGSAQQGTDRTLRAAAIDGLGAALDSVDPSVPPAPTVRLHEVYRRAIACIDEEPDLMLTVVELAARLGVTTRTLRYAFGYSLDISPYQFLLRRRMTIVRDALLDPARPERTVLDLLLSMGISHQGEFAGQYRRLFGESPSETRARALAGRQDPPRPDGWARLLRASR